MIKEKEKEWISVPCKDTFTGKLETLEVLAYDFASAKDELFYVLGLNWQIGYRAF